MIHQRQRLAFSLEACYDALGVHAELDNFERDPAAHGRLLLSHVNDAATAFADLLEDFVPANRVSGFLGGRQSKSQGRVRHRWLTHETTGPLGSAKQSC